MSGKVPQRFSEAIHRKAIYLQMNYFLLCSVHLFFLSIIIKQVFSSFLLSLLLLLADLNEQELSVHQGLAQSCSSHEWITVRSFLRKEDEIFKCSVRPSFSERSAIISRQCRHARPTSLCVVFQLVTAAVLSVLRDIQVIVSWGETHPLSNGPHRDRCYWMIHQINGWESSSSMCSWLEFM